MKRFINCAFKIIFSRTLFIILMILVQLAVLCFGFTKLGESFSYITEGMSLLGALLVIFIVNRDGAPEFKMTWCILICLLPVFGALIYLFVELNLGGIGLKARTYVRLKETEGLLLTTERTKKAVAGSQADFRGFARYMEGTVGFPAYQGSEAVYYPSGEDKFKDLLKELQKAERFIFLEYFIMERGIMWNAILDILKEKVKQGVEVRVMYDGMCSIMLLPYGYPRELEKYGIKAKMFAPIRPFLSTNQNNRDHRKIVVIDGKVAFTGGVNLADEYINEKEVYGHWKDTAVKITGEAVRSFTVMYLQMWHVSENGAADEYEKYLQNIVFDKPLKDDGFVIPYGEMPTVSTEVAKTVYESLFNTAKKYVHVMTPYFIVEQEFFDTMRYAAQRGVEVKMILPHIPDKKIVYYIARNYYPKLLEAGIQVYEYTPGFVHAKVFSVDGSSATVGTINLDYRSFYHHFECGCYFYDSSVIQDIEADFQRTLEDCQEVTMEYYKKLPLHQKLIGTLFKLIAPLM